MSGITQLLDVVEIDLGQPQDLLTVYVDVYDKNFLHVYYYYILYFENEKYVNKTFCLV